MSSKSPKAQRKREPLTLEEEAQQVLKALWSEELIPFALNVGKITKEVDGYTLHFYDSRMHTARVPLPKVIRLRTWFERRSWIALLNWVALYRQTAWLANKRFNNSNALCSSSDLT